MEYGFLGVGCALAFLTVSINSIIYFVRPYIDGAFPEETVLAE